MNTILLKSIKDLVNYKFETKDIINLMVGSFTLLHKGHINTIKVMVDKGSSALIILNQKGSHLDMFDYREILKHLGVKILFVIEMHVDSYEVGAIDFVFLVKESFPALKNIFSGSDWRFGKNREGDYRTFMSSGVHMQIVPFMLSNSEKISSSVIWKGLTSQEDFNDSISLLPIKPFTNGEIIFGNQQGRKLGFPTANIQPFNSYMPPIGIYITKSKIEGDPKLYNSITNIGFAPSVNDGNGVLRHETHILNFNNDVYGKFMKCYYMKRIGKERNHHSKEDLICFIQEIKDEAIRFFSEQR